MVPTGRKKRLFKIAFPNIVFGMAGLALLSGLAGPAGAREKPLERRGGIAGVVSDAEVRSPLAGVRVKIVGRAEEAVSNGEGRFAFPSLPVGGYTLEFAFPYFRTKRVADIVVKSGRATQIAAEMELDTAAVDNREITVSADYYPTGGEAVSSTTAFSHEEIRRAAGAAGDVTRMIGALPSVARTNDTMNHLIVRGGSPAENAFYVDNIEIPNINHYPHQGASSGPIGLLNVEFIRNVEFSAGGFSPVFGDRMSSVMDIAFREGNREAAEFQLDLSMMGLGLVAEGPLPAGKGSWMVSARRSYIDLLIRLMGSGVPVSWSDLQAKLVYDLSPRNTLTFLAVAGFDDSGTKKEDAVKDAENTFGELDTTESAVGLNWFHQWGAAGYSNTSLSRSGIRYREAFRDTLSEDLLKQAANEDEAWTLRNVTALRLAPGQRLTFGAEAKRLVSRFDSFQAAAVDVLGKPSPAVVRNGSVRSDLYSAFAQFAWDPIRPLTLRLGLRADRFEFSRALRLSPRLSLSWRMAPKNTLEISGGVFHQQLPPALLVQAGGSAAILEPRAVHFILGFRRLLAPDTQLSVEIYAKDYRRMPLDPAQPSLFLLDEFYRDNRFAEHGPLVFEGRARSSGVEVILQKKLADRIYGLASFSYFRTRYRGYDRKWYDRVYDNRYIVCVEGGWKAGRAWEIGVRGNYAGGAPFTPFDLEASRAAATGIFDTGRTNAERLPHYLSLNLRADRRFNFRGSNLILYLSLWNIFNRKNVAAVYWNKIEGRPGEIVGWSFLPVLGIEFEF
jgi:hypothetical protein